MKARNFRTTLISSLVIGLILLLSLCASAGETELQKSTSWEGPEKWMLDDTGVLRITGEGKMYDYSSSDIFEAYFHSPAYSNQSIKEVIIEDGITNIGDCAFYNCSSLEKIQIPDSVTYIGENAFANCTSLKSIIIPEGVTEIRAGAFSECTSLSDIVIPDSVEYIMSSLYFPDTFADTAYYKNADNWNVDGTLYINNHLIGADEDVIKGTIEVRKGTKTIAERAFLGLNNLTGIILHDGVVSVGKEAFSDCSNLSEVVIPDSVAIMKESFEYTAYYENDENWKDGVLYAGKHLIKAKNDSVPNNYTIKPDTKTIFEGAFEGCDHITQIIIPNTVKNINDYTFMNCKSLNSIIIPASVENISKLAFYNPNYFFSSKPPVTICGYEGTTASDYAKKMAIPFINISTATPTNAKVLINGKEVAFTAYNIGGNNYFKLRDVAMAINGSEKNFNVGWDSANNAISLTSNQGYTSVGGELIIDANATETTPIVTNSRVYKDGEPVSFIAFNIGGNNFFKLRDIGKAFDFGIGWDNATKTITVNTGMGYTE